MTTGKARMRTATRNRFRGAAAAAVVAAALSACSAPAPSASPGPSTPAGTVAKGSGEAGSLVDSPSGAEVFSIRVNSIETATECEARTGAFTLSPERGTFLVVDLVATLSSGAVGQDTGADADEAYMPLVPEAFSVVPATGPVEHDVTSASAWGCLSEEELAPAVVNPDETVAGKVVLDTGAARGTVIYDPDGTGGWSWPFGT